MILLDLQWEAMAHNIKRPWKDLISGRGGKKGQVAVLFALCAAPLLLAASIAVDMSNASNMKSKLQAAADSAVLAAATRLAVGASEEDKEQIAIDTFYANLSPVLQSSLSSPPSVDIDFPARTVSLRPLPVCRHW